MKRDLILCVGAPASGKSTYSKELSKTKDYIRVCRDDFRLMFKQSQLLSKEEENVITKLVQYNIVSLYNETENNIVIDQTNCNEHRLRQFINDYSDLFDIKLKLFDEPLEVLLERNNKRTTDKVPEYVIVNMHKNLQSFKHKFEFI